VKRALCVAALCGLVVAAAAGIAWAAFTCEAGLCECYDMPQNPPPQQCVMICQMELLEADACCHQCKEGSATYEACIEDNDSQYYDCVHDVCHQ